MQFTDLMIAEEGLLDKLKEFRNKLKPNDPKSYMREKSQLTAKYFSSAEGKIAWNKLIKFITSETRRMNSSLSISKFKMMMKNSGIDEYEINKSDIELVKSHAMYTCDYSEGGYEYIEYIQGTQDARNALASEELAKKIEKMLPEFYVDIGDGDEGCLYISVNSGILDKFKTNK